MTDNEIIAASQAICDAMSDEDGDVKRDILGHVGNTWSLYTVHYLGVHGKLRFSALLGHIEGISQRMLTKTLRDLERDGLITRTMFLEVPPRVEYELTALGNGLLSQIVPLWSWIISQTDSVKKARLAYDKK
jgi:DNA-binding HxlR family transcriptional regulator